MRILILLIVLISLVTLVTAQPGSNRKRAAQVARTGLDLMDQGKLTEGIDLLEQAAKLDPKNPEYAIRAGQGRFQLGEYERARDLVYPWTQKRRSDPRAWQLYGNSLDLLNKPGLAMDAYNAGIKKHPQAGFLYLEKGIVAWTGADKSSAIRYWEDGIEAQPGFSGNYYWATKSLSETDEKLWAILYGELFLNLERGTDRTEEISSLLYQTYEAALVRNADSLVEMHFSAYAKGQAGFETTFESVFDRSYLPGDASVTIAQLHRSRDLFLSHWFETEHKDYPNALFNWQRELQLAGRLEAYNYWLFFDGNSAEFATWQQAHSSDIETFESWFAWNKMPLEGKHWPIRNQK